MANAHIRELRLPGMVEPFDLRLADAEAVAIAGATVDDNTRLLRAIAGLDSVAGGSIRLGDLDAHQLPAGHRQVAMVLRDLALYPHLDVAANITFPLRHAGSTADRAESVEERLEELAALFELSGLLEARPPELSATQRVRVAFARAVARRPRLLLVDDALHGLSEVERLRLRPLLRDLQQSWRLKTIYATSDSSDAMSLADRIAILADGRTHQIDTPSHVYANPASVAAARALGSPPINLLPGTLSASVLEIGDQTVELPAAPNTTAPTDVTVGIRAEAFAAGPVAEASVVAILDPGSREPFGSHSIVRGRVGDHPVVVRVPGDAGDVERRAAAPAIQLLLFRRDDGERLR